jgi:hypothetical protein
MWELPLKQARLGGGNIKMPPSESLVKDKVFAVSCCAAVTNDPLDVAMFVNSFAVFIGQIDP